MKDNSNDAPSVGLIINDNLVGKPIIDKKVKKEYELKYNNEDYLLIMEVNNKSIYFTINKIDSINECKYENKYDSSEIVKILEISSDKYSNISLLLDLFDTIYKKNKFSLDIEDENTIYLKIKFINIYEEVEYKLKLFKSILNNEDKFNVLFYQNRNMKHEIEELKNLICEKDKIINNFAEKLENQEKEIYEIKNIINNSSGTKIIKNYFTEENITNTPNNFIENFTYKHVIIIGVDGAGNFHNKCNTPNMDKIFSEGSTTDYCKASLPSMSAECWGSMFTGVKPEIHKLTNDIAEKEEYKNSDYPTFFKLVRNSHPNAEIGAFCNWIPIFNGIIERDINIRTETGSDEDLIKKICIYIQQNKPELLFIQFDSVDEAGHSHGYCSNLYLQALEKIDEYIGKIYESIINSKILDETLLIITSDHGGIKNDHGGNSENEINTFFGAIGKTIKKNNNLNIIGRDLAAIVTFALGVKGNPKWESKIPENLFKKIEFKNITPANSKITLLDYIDINKINICLFFDGDCKDIKNNEINIIGKVNFEDSQYGKCVYISNEGYISIPKIKFAKKNFSICFWIKIDSKSKNGDPCIFSNKNWNNGSNNGFSFAFCGKNNGFFKSFYYGEDIDFKFNVGNGNGKRDDFVYNNCQIFDNWNHIIFTINRKTGDIKYYLNFELFSQDKLKTELSMCSFDNNMPFNIGQDGTGRYDHYLYSYFKDFLIFNDVIEQEEIFNIKEFYLTNY